MNNILLQTWERLLSFYSSFSSIVKNLPDISSLLISTHYLFPLFWNSGLSFKHQTFILHRFLFDITWITYQNGSFI